MRTDSIVHVLLQHDGGKVETMNSRLGCRQNQEAKLKIVGGDLPGSNQQTILTLVYTFIELVAHVLIRPAFQTEDPDPYPLSNGGQN